MINFLDSKLKPEITVDCPCTDGFEVSNLIKSNDTQGFIAYQTIKPPISLDITLIFAIRISVIKIWNRVGAQISTGFELQLLSSTQGYVTVYKSYNLDQNCNHLSIASPKYHNLQNHGDKSCFKIAPQSNYLMQNCRKLRLKILQTNKSVPCLKRVEIWGQTRSDDESRIVEILLNDNKNKNKNDSKLIPTEIENVIQKSLKIPEEFLDAITCEMMSTPMTLPSGKNVDLTTLEKHKKSEEIWGRNATDPFTGLDFIQDRKPVLNSYLKNRIDHFLLLNAHNPDTFQIPRTVGSFYNSHSVRKKKCLKCSEEPNDVYRLPCNHVYCRRCLSLKCLDCSQTSNNYQIEKIYQ